MFDGKYQKICSVLAGMASAYFSKELSSRIPEKNNTLGIFDCRVWNVDTYDLVYENFKWRQSDAIKNSISMAAQALFKHKELHGLNSNQKKHLLINVNKPWEDEPDFFKYGTFVFRKSVYMNLTEDQLKNIPKEHQPTEPIKRHVIETVSIIISSIDQFNGLTKEE
jgi:tRNA(His) 5'-end guanylyltransferase